MDTITPYYNQKYILKINEKVEELLFNKMYYQNFKLII